MGIDNGLAMKWLMTIPQCRLSLYWNDFCFQLSERFDDHHTRFARVRHTTSVDAYIKNFANRFRLQTFLVGLKHDLVREVRSFRPTSRFSQSQEAGLHPPGQIRSSFLGSHQPPVGTIVTSTKPTHHTFVPTTP